MKRLLLVDAMAFIFRAYFGYNSHHLTNKRGEDTSAIYGFCIFLDELIKKLSPTHIGVAFEGRGDNFRKQHYTEYKAQRPPAPQPIVDAIPIIQSILTARHIPVLQVDGYEADDIIGTLSIKALAGGMDEIYMATPDKDYAQLVNDKVRICKPRKTGGYDILGVEEICNKYGLTAPKQVIDMLALMGDHSDNIPGCTGIGEKTAIKLLQQFGTIDYMYAHREDIHGLLEEHVLTQEEQVRFSYYLATIVLDAPIEFSAEQFQRYDPDNKALRAIYADLDFRSFVARIDEKEMQHDLFS